MQINFFFVLGGGGPVLVYHSRASHYFTQICIRSSIHSFLVADLNLQSVVLRAGPRDISCSAKCSRISKNFAGNLNFQSNFLNFFRIPI